MIIAPILLLIAGTGRNTGKTTLACSIIKRFSANHKVIGLKISPHFHGGTKSLKTIISNENFNIYEETSSSTGKDSAAMLKAEASNVFYIEVLDEYLETAFEHFQNIMPSPYPIVCESPALINYVKPGVFFIVDNENNKNKKKEIFLKRKIADKWIDTGKEKILTIIENLHCENNVWRFR